MWNELPKDPMILLSLVNTKLRNHYDSLDAFCQDMGIEKQELTDRLGQIDYEYMEERNQFV
ncbi:DUF4250 domain-containing protein [Schaedlerella sp.]|jgi:hypothetical protein|uniref:DUF4250 domain-containing protein n=1 Tax=Schaedlerella sp. TaxID=2676057 RepID=UPI00136455D1|nr:DUF4250 domain-containing protein [uncultured Schaedlerella sp.]MCI8766432.1 DUF4250 domain-containing protein [Ruminococcus sp.]MCI9328809.1 DUF4250 domain-containing protein [Ruminococcus sp.]NBI99604.1 DUF4250 domain-containing protein [Lachnospiraceae bacterium]